MVLRKLIFTSLWELQREWFETRGIDLRHDGEFLRSYEDRLKKRNATPDDFWYERRRPNEEDTPGDESWAGTKQWAGRLRRNKLWHLMVGPEHRGFFKACQRARGDTGLLLAWRGPEGELGSIIRDECPSPTGYLGRIVRDRLGPDGDLEPIWTPEDRADRRRAFVPALLAHLLCARDAGPDREAAGKIRSEVERETGVRLSLNFLRDLAAEMLDGHPRPAERTASIAVVLLRHEDKGITADLTLEIVEDGEGDLYPNPGMALIYRAPDFRGAEDRARAAVAGQLGLELGSCGRDARWRLSRRDGGNLLPDIVGPSTSAALGLLYAHLVAATRARQLDGVARQGPDPDAPDQLDVRSIIANLGELDLSGVAISAEIGADSRLGAIGGAITKAFTARREDPWLPRIHTMVFSLDQKNQGEGDAGPPLDAQNEPDGEFQTVFAGTLREAFRTLANDSRWARIMNASEELERHGTAEGLGREMDRVVEFLRAEHGNYQLVQADELLNTGAFAGELIRGALARSYAVAYHFIRTDREDWDDHVAILTSLGDQLRRLFALRRRPEDDGKPPVARFQAIVDRVGASLARLREMGKDDLRAVLVLNGLDRSFRSGGRSHRVVLRDILPASLPPGVKLVLISRKGPHLHVARCPSDEDPIDLDPWRQRAPTPEDADEQGRLAKAYAALMLSGSPSLRSGVRASSIFSRPETIEALKAVRPDLDWEDAVLPALMTARLIRRVTGDDEQHRFIVYPLIRNRIYDDIPGDGGDVTRKALHARAAAYFDPIARRLTEQHQRLREREGDAEQAWLSSVDLLLEHLLAADDREKLLARQAMIRSAYQVKYNWGDFDDCRAVVEGMLAAAVREERTDIEIDWIHAKAVLGHTTGDLADSEDACRNGWRRVITALAAGPRPDEGLERYLIEMGGHLQCRLGMVLRDQGRYEADDHHPDGALECFARSLDLKRAAARKPSNDFLYNGCLWAEVLSEQGQLEEARKTLEDAVKIALDDAARRKGVVHRAACFVPMFVRVLRRQGDYEHALALARLARFMAAGIHHWLHLVQNLREIALIGIVTKEWQPAEEAFQEIQASNRFAETDEVLPFSETTRTQLALGLLHHLRRDLAQARLCYKGAIRPGIYPANYQASVLLGLVGLEERVPVEGGDLYQPREDLDRGIVLCRDLLSKSSRALEPAYFLARAQLLRGRLEEAEGRVAEGEGQYGSALASLRVACQICAAKGVVDEEFQFLELAEKIEPQTTRFAAALRAARERLWSSRR
jgi:tetratricopeptide (TPR) repeat protein